MSKIQDALRKIQASRRTTGLSSNSSAKAVKAVASVKRRSSTGAGEAEIETDPIVTVEYDQLRELGLLAPTEQQRHIADQYRLIKRPLLDNISGTTAHQSADANLIMVASPLPGDGKTFTCINLALSMATEKDRSVLLVDADVAKPHISSLFGIADEPGLIDLLVERDRNVDDLLLSTNVPGLKILSAGRQDANATELLASRRMADVVDQLSSAYTDRVVIFDSPPLLATSEARVLASRMGQVVLVVSSDVTPQRAVLDAIESLDPDKAISVILNQSSEGLGGGGYGGYGYGSGPIEQE